ncbi:MAG: flagellar hook-associated protein FlgK [Salinarimonas sp.]|nr:flagellar hook-associated protein FlgK [Salinarimonas sp.]
MNLSVALSSAQSALSATSTQTSIISRNISGAADPGYSRKMGLTSSMGFGGVKVVSVGRAADTALYNRMLDATAGSSAQQALLNGFETLAGTVDDPQLNQSVSASLGKLTDALQMQAESPGDPVLGAATLSAAYDLAGKLNESAQTTQRARAEADTAMADSVDRINDLLKRFESANRAIVVGTQSGTDVSDELDTRDRILGKLSEEVGISTVTRAGNDMVIYTDSGVTLFEKSARTISFDRTFAYEAGTTGNAVFADGVPLTGPGASMGIKSGALFGHATLRDNVAPQYQLQLDEIARGLIHAFGEPDPGDAPGIFVDPGPAGAGLAARIGVNPDIDPALGGDLAGIRDGVNVNFNPDGDAAFSDRIYAMLDALNAPQGFDPATGINPNTTLARFASSSVSWLEAGRQQASQEASFRDTMLERTRESLSNATGVNLDEELALMMELERSYGASARIISTVDNMLQSLLAATR